MQDAYRALGRGDLLTFLSVLHEQVEWHLPLGVDPTVHYGQVAIVQNVLDSRAGPNPSYEPDGFLTGRDHVVVLGRVTSDPAARAARFAHLWLFENGLAVRIHAFEDCRPVKTGVDPWGRISGIPARSPVT